METWLFQTAVQFQQKIHLAFTVSLVVFQNLADSIDVFLSLVLRRSAVSLIDHKLQFSPKR